MFRGRFEHSFDDKGRLAVPARFRDLMFEKSPLGDVIVTNFDRCLAVYALPQWEDLERKIAALPQFDPGVTSFLRYFVSGATECQIDKAGRILLPANLRTIAGIERDCVVVGQLTKFEIWAVSRWNQMFDNLNGEFMAVASRMSQLGLNL